VSGLDTSRLTAAVEPLVGGWRWAASGAAVGILPLSLCWLLEFPGQRWLTAALLLPFFLALVVGNRARAAYGLVLVTFIAHSAAAISLTLLDPAAAASLFTGGADYWQRSEAWIRTGVDPERNVAAWLPAQLRETAGMVVFGATSLGLVPLAQGVYQIDLMNYFVGRLIPASRSAVVALLVGWHLWAVLRGIGYTRLVYEATSLTLSRLLQRPLAMQRERARRWAVGLSFVAADLGLKALALDTVRRALAANLLGR